MEIKGDRLMLALLFAGAAGMVLLRLFDPATSGLFPPCPVRYLTGLYCPGCGSLRAIHALLHGDLRQAWAMNPLTVILLPYVAYSLISQSLLAWRGRGLPAVTLPSACIQALGIVIVLFGIARNLPLAPFLYLAPGATLHL